MKKQQKKPKVDHIKRLNQEIAALKSKLSPVKAEKLLYANLTKNILAAAEKAKKQLADFADTSGWDYVTKAKEHAQRNFACFDMLNPTGSVLELGSGAGFFQYICMKRGLSIYAVDVAAMSNPIFQFYDEVLENRTDGQKMHPSRPMDWAGSYDHIVSLLLPVQKWTLEDQIYFLYDCYRHLKDGGNVFVHLPKGCPEKVLKLYVTLAAKTFTYNKDSNIFLIDKAAIGKYWGIPDTLKPAHAFTSNG